MHNSCISLINLGLPRFLPFLFTGFCSHFFFDSFLTLFDPILSFSIRSDSYLTSTMLSNYLTHLILNLTEASFSLFFLANLIRLFSYSSLQCLSLLRARIITSMVDVERPSGSRSTVLKVVRSKSLKFILTPLHLSELTQISSHRRSLLLIDF